jgi:hypothetical protein
MTETNNAIKSIFSFLNVRVVAISDLRKNLNPKQKRAKPETGNLRTPPSILRGS